MKMLFIVAINSLETIKVIYPMQDTRWLLFQNEIEILTKLNEGSQYNLSFQNGIVQLIDGGNAKWQILNKEKLSYRCFVVVHTYGEPLFPILRQCVFDNDRKMLFWYFSEMVSAKKHFNV